MPFTAPFTPHSEEDDAVHDFDTFTDPSEIEDSLKRISVARGLKRFRENHQIYQVVMAKMMGVSKRSYIDYEHNGRAVPSSALSKLLAHTGLDLNELFTGKPQPVTSATLRAIVRKSISIEKILSNRDDKLDPSIIEEAARKYIDYFGTDGSIDIKKLDDLVSSILYQIERDAGDEALLSYSEQHAE